ncbi:MAG: ATP-binding protein [Emergencia sp.]|jgi:sensor histidine kinase YesM|nr:ATP-binding protein [Emergencia sp.]
MNVLYTGVYFIDILRLAAVLCGIFGFSFSMRRSALLLGAVLVLTGAVVTLLLSDPSNRIFVSLFVQMMFAVICFAEKKRVLAEVTFLLHFALMTAEALVQSVIAMFWYAGMVLESEREVALDAICGMTTCIVILGVTAAISKYTRPVLQRYLKQFGWKQVLYYAVWIFAAGVAIGVASMVAVDNGMIYRYKVAMQLAVCVLGIGMLAFGVLLNVLYEQRKKLKEDDQFKQRCIEQQAAQYEEITVKNKKLLSFRHDQKAYLLALRALIDEGDLTQLRRYTEDLEQKARDFDYIATGNLVADAIVNAQAAWAEEAAVDFFVAGRFPAQMRISDADLAMLLSNGLKNACEAAERCAEKREVFVLIKSYKKMLFLEIRNTAIEAPRVQDGQLLTSKQDKENHGIGTQNMQQVVEKYDGTLTWEYDEEGQVTTKIEI